MKDYSRVVRTGLFSKIAYEVIASVVGQWSDGKYENDPSKRKYWMFCNVMQDVNGEVLIGINSRYAMAYGYRKHVSNGFIDMTDEEVKALFAKYIELVAKRELKNNGIIRGWNPSNRNNFTVDLSSKTLISFAQAFCVSKILAGMPFFPVGDDESVVIGKPLDEQATATNVAKRKKVEDINAKYAKKLEDLAAECKAMHEKLEKEFSRKRARINKSWNAQLAKAEAV